MSCENCLPDHGDYLLRDLPEGSIFKLNPCSQREFIVINSELGEVCEVSPYVHGLVRRFPPYWWCFIFY